MSSVKFGEVVKEIKDNVDRSNNPYEFFVAGDHMDTEELYIKRRGRFEGTDVGPAFTRIFKPGQVLYGSRRTYLKKVAMANFEGITANTTFVLESKDETKLITKLLPFIMYSNEFTQYSISHSKGSTNPYILFKDLENYEFNLPELDEQKKLAEVLWQIVATMESYKKLLAKTDEMVKAKFVEMFGDTKKNIKNFPIKKIGDFAECIAGATPSTKVKEYWENGTIPWMSSGEVHNGRVYDTLEKITQEGYNNCSTKLIRPHSVVIALAGQGKTRGTVAVIEKEICTNQSLCAIVQNEKIIDTDFLYYQLKFRYLELRQLSGVTEGRGGLNLKNIQGIDVLVPDLDKQHVFTSIIKKAEESKSAIQASLDSVTKVYKKIIAENLGGKE